MVWNRSLYHSRAGPYQRHLALITIRYGESEEKKRKMKEPTERHLKIRAASDVASKWELDLELVMSLLAPYMTKKNFVHLTIH